MKVGWNGFRSVQVNEVRRLGKVQCYPTKPYQVYLNTTMLLINIENDVFTLLIFHAIKPKKEILYLLYWHIRIIPSTCMSILNIFLIYKPYAQQNVLSFNKHFPFVGLKFLVATHSSWLRLIVAIWDRSIWKHTYAQKL